MESHLQIWSDLECNGGSIVVPGVQMLQGIAERRIDNNDAASFTVLRDSTETWWLDSVGLRDVVRSTDALNTVTEWRISEIRDGRGNEDGPLMTFTAEPVILDLANALVLNQTAGGHTDFNLGGLALTPAEYVDTFAVPSLAAQGMSWVEPGTITPTGIFDMAWPFFTVLEFLQEIAFRADASELWLQRNGGSSYQIMIGTRGAGSTVVRCEMGRNLYNIRRFQEVVNLVTACMPVGGKVAGANEVETLGFAAWEVTAKDVDTPSTGTDRLTVADPNGGSGPLAFDDQANSWYLLAPDATLHDITDSDATNQYVFIADASAIAVGDHVEFRADSDGSLLTELTHPTNVLDTKDGGLGRFLAVVENADMRGERNHAPNPLMDDWASGDVPDGWTQLTSIASKKRDLSVTGAATGAADGTQTDDTTILVKQFPASTLVQVGDVFTSGAVTRTVTTEVTLDGTGAGTITLNSTATVSNNDGITITRPTIIGVRGANAIYMPYEQTSTSSIAEGNTAVRGPAYTVKFLPTLASLWFGAGYTVHNISGGTQTLNSTGSTEGIVPGVYLKSTNASGIVSSVAADDIATSSGSFHELALRKLYTMTEDDEFAVGFLPVRHTVVGPGDFAFSTYLRWVGMWLGSDPLIPPKVGSHGNDLWHYANTTLTDSVATRYEITLQDLAALNCYDPDAETLVLGGDVRVIDDVLGIDATARIVAIRADLMEPMRTLVTLAINRPEAFDVNPFSRFAPRTERPDPVNLVDEVAADGTPTGTKKGDKRAKEDGVIDRLTEDLIGRVT